MDENRTETVSAWQLVILALSLYVLITLLVETVFVLPADVKTILDMADTAICVVFLGDFFVSLYRAKSRWGFLKWGWIDFISSIPMVGPLRWGRVVRAIRILRILRAVRSLKVLVGFLVTQRRRSILASAVFITITVVLFASILVLQFETRPDSNIKGAGDAIWWAVVTIATVGYGDRYPVTTGGRIVGVFLMTAGLALFSTFVGYIATWFLDPGQKPKTEEMESVHARLDRIEKLLEEMKKEKGTPSGPASPPA